MDNELEHSEALLLLATLKAQPELQHKLNRYSAISHALKSDDYVNVQTDFSDKIAQRIKQEPVPIVLKSVSFKKAYQWLALAASMAIIAFIVKQSFNSQLFEPAATLQIAQRWLPQQSDLNKRISLYLQEHDSNAYAQGEENVKPYAKVTTYNQK